MKRMESMIELWKKNWKGNILVFYEENIENSAQFQKQNNGHKQLSSSSHDI